MPGRVLIPISLGSIVIQWGAYMMRETWIHINALNLKLKNWMNKFSIVKK